MNARPIVRVPLESQINWPSRSGEDDSLLHSFPNEVNGRLVTIRSADSHGQRSSANILVDRRYGWRGYLSNASATLGESVPSRITLVASDHDITIGTITVGFDCRDGLHVDELFGQEAQALREAGHTLCEFTKLAIDGDIQSKRVLASLFNVAYLYAHRIMGFDTLLIEVNPRHARFYQRMLGFKPLGPQRLNGRVNAVAVLLGLDFAHSRQQILRFAGQMELANGERSLYPYFFSHAEERGILARLTSIPAASPPAAGAPNVIGRVRRLQ